MLAQRAWLVPACALCVSLVACKRGARAADAGADLAAAQRAVIVIDQVGVEVVLWPAGAGPEPEGRSIAARIWETLAQSTDFASAAPDGLPDAGPGTGPGPGTMRRPARMRVEVGVQPIEATAAKPRLLRGAASLTLSWVGGERDDEEEDVPPSGAAVCEGELPADVKQLGPASLSLVECAVGQAVRALVDKQAVRRGDEAAVMMALESSDPSLRQVALGVIAERQMRSAVPRLLELLKSKDELTRDGAIGALVALREPRAVPVLTELAEFRDLDLMRRVIDAIGAIGGDEARAYLELVASGHDVPAVRDLAADALRRLLRRAGDAGV